jgi:uncharacterized protein (DUF2141 family)
MKTQMMVIFIFFTQFVFAQTAKLTIIIDKITPAKGNLELGIYNNAKKFAVEGNEYKTISFHASTDTETITVALPIGEYAIAVYHDKNKNNKCDKNLLRIPTEAYGFSNNIKPRFSAPDFKDTKFYLNKDKTIRISLIH